MSRLFIIPGSIPVPLGGNRFRRCVITSILGLWTMLPLASAAQLPVAAVVQAGIKKVIVALDLKVQRMQNSTLALENEQKLLETRMSTEKLSEIAGWVTREKQLFQGYYDALWQVKGLIVSYHEVRETTQLATGIVSSYQHFWTQIRADPHFSPEELAYIGRVYAGMLEQASRDTGQLLSVLQPFTARMSDADRMALIDEAAADMEKTYGDLTRFNQDNALLSLSRAGDREEAGAVQKLYGLP